MDILCVLLDKVSVWTAKYVLNHVSSKMEWVVEICACAVRNST